MKIFLSDNIKNSRQRMSLTQKQLGEIFSVSPQAVSKWERREAYPDLCLLPEIARFFGCTVDEILGKLI